MSNDKERLLDAPEVYERLREEVTKTRLSQGELAEKMELTRAYLVKLLNGKAAISGRAIKAFFNYGLDVKWIFTGKSDRERIRKLEEKIENVKELIREGFFKSDEGKS